MTSTRPIATGRLTLRLVPDIEKGKQVEPNDRQKTILEAGARVVNRVADFDG